MDAARRTDKGSQQGRMYVGSFESENTVEDVNQAGPEGEQQQVPLMPQGTGLAENPVFAEERRHEARPGHEAGDEDRDEVVPGMEAFVHLGGEAQKVFADEEEIEEVRILLADQVVPGHGDDQEEDDARQVEEFEEEARPLAQQGIPEEDAKGEDDGDEAFREHAETHGSVEDEQVFLVFRPFKDVERDQAGIDEKGQGHVHDADRGDDELQCRRSHDDGSQEPCALVVHGLGQPEGQEDVTKARQGRQDAASEFTDAKELHGQGRDPVLENRLLEIGHVIEVGRDVVAGQDHFHGDPVIASFVEVDEMIRPDVGQVQKGRSGDEQAHQKAPVAAKCVSHKIPPIYVRYYIVYRKIINKS